MMDLYQVEFLHIQENVIKPNHNEIKNILFYDKENNFWRLNNIYHEGNSK